jgi:serine protease Do
VAPTENNEPTPAAKAGLQPGDIIVEFENAPVANAQDLIQRVASTPVGQQVTIGFLRDVNGKLDKKTVSVVLSERPSSVAAREWEGSPKPAPKTADPRGNALHLGITLAELTPQLMADKHLSNVQGLLVPPSGAAALIEGDVVNRINRTPVTTLADFTRVLNTLKPGDPVVLNVTRTDPRGNRQVPLIVQFTYQ